MTAIIFQIEELNQTIGKLQQQVENQNQSIKQNEEDIEKKEKVVQYLQKQLNSNPADGSTPTTDTTNNYSTSAYQFRSSYRTLYPNYSLNKTTSSPPVVQYQPKTGKIN
jgi:chromosome segregation ATPase